LNENERATSVDIDKFIVEQVCPSTAHTSFPTVIE